MVIAVCAALAVNAAAGEAPSTRPAGAGPKAHVVVFDFECEGNAVYGRQLADSVRLKLRRHGDYFVLDRLSTQEASGPIGLKSDRDKVLDLMKRRLGVNLAIYGTVQKLGESVRAEVYILDIRGVAEPEGAVRVFSDETERARGVIATGIVEAVTGRPAWVPPQYGDEPEPKEFGKALNINGDFEKAHAGWDEPDNVSTFLVAAGGRGTILRVRTDLARDPWLAYRKALRLGKADPSRPPKIARDTSYGSVAGLEGVHFRSAWIKATPGRRYWLVADHNGQGGAKVFVKGFRRTPAAFDGLPESALAALGIAPEQFAELSGDERKKLIETDAKKNPMRYMRECYRWYLNCKEAKGEWMHFAAPFPPRGGLPVDVEYLQIQIYSYWPPGEYLWDNVHLYLDPTQEDLLPEEPARTPGFKRRKELTEQELRKGRKPPDTQPHE